MKKIITVLLILFSLTSSVYADAILNGVDWKSLHIGSGREIEKFCKLLFVRGVYDGVGFAGDIEFKKVFFIEGKEKNFYGYLIDMLDKFYSDGRNINIPIAEALFIISCELRGMKQEGIEELTELGRKNANKHPLRYGWRVPTGLEKQQNEIVAPTVKGYEDNSQFWRALGQELSSYSQQQDLKRVRGTESIQSSIQVIGTRPTYRINNGYVYPVESDKSAYRVVGGYLYPSDDNIHILGNEKK